MRGLQQLEASAVAGDGARCSKENLQHRCTDTFDVPAIENDLRAAQKVFAETYLQRLGSSQIQNRWQHNGIRR